MGLNTRKHMGSGRGFNPSSGMSSSIGNFSLSTALHQWSYQQTSITGTTMTAVDFGSIGALNQTNPDAASLPTLNADSIEFDGVSEYLKNDVADFRIGDTTGVLHSYVFFNTGVANRIFASADTAGNNNDIRLGGLSTDNIEFRIRDAATNYNLLTTPTYSGWKVVSIVQDGTNARAYVDGAKVTTYDTDDVGTRWFNSVLGRDNISIGAIIRLAPLFSELKIKYLGYAPYVNDATVISEQNEILNSNL